MYVRTIAATAGIGLTAAMLGAAAPAHRAPGHGPPGHGGHGGHPSHGQKHKVLETVENYFSDRDQGWLPASEQPEAELSAARVASQPKAAASQVEKVARAAADERGLVVDDVSTAFARGAKVKLRGSRAVVTTTPTTLLTWTDAELGSSSLSDTYRVTLKRTKGPDATATGGGGKRKQWRVEDVTLVDPPTTEESAEGSKPWPRPRPKALAEAEKDTPSAGSSDVRASSTYDRDAAAAYARYWSGVDIVDIFGIRFTVDRYNSDYDGVWSEAPTAVNDCTNFTSQMLQAGGWPKVDGVRPGNIENWTDNLWGPYRASETWTVAYQQWRFAANSDRAVHWKSGRPSETDAIWDLEPGDLLYADWDPDRKPDGKIDHAMAISGTYTSMGFTEPTYSQHTPHRNNIPLSIGIKIAMSEPGSGDGPDNGQGRDVIYYPVHVKDTIPE